MDKKQTKVKVIIRVRPPLNDTEKISVNVEENAVSIFNHRNTQENIQYSFSGVYDMDSSQQEIYSENVKPLLHNAINGQNVSIFAYGPTGAGKTHTMLGTPSCPGVIPRVVNGIFDLIEEERNKGENEWQYKVSFSFLEIYNEKVQDLLEPSGVDLPIREDRNKNILISGLATKEIKNFDDFKNAFGPASNNRTVAATKLNNHSSRSHSIVQLMVIKSKPCKKLYGKVYLIDLAGSEDNRRTGNQGIRLKESGAINKSLFALGEVVDAINAGLPRIPFRNSKLTRLLQDSIGGTCHSLMITNIAPEERYYYDTYCTLNFATKSKKIVNNTVVREKVGIVKPQPKIQKVPPNTHLDEEQRQVKKAKLDTSSESLNEDLTPSYSPLLKRQTNLEEEVERRLQEFENNMMNRIKSISSILPHQQPGAETPKTKAIQEMQRQLEASNAQIKELSRKYLMGPPPVPATPKTPTEEVLESDSSVKLDKTPDNTMESDNSVVSDNSVKQDNSVKRPNSVSFSYTATISSAKQILKGKPVLKQQNNENKQRAKSERPITGIKRKKEEEFSCSPLFVRSKKFNNGFVSSACTNDSSDLNKENRIDDVDTADEKNSATSETQMKRNEEFLNILNTGSIKQLQSLQTVGAKRANLIHEWREANGEFSKAEELLKIPGINEKYFQKLLYSNLITAS